MQSDLETTNTDSQDTQALPEQDFHGIPKHDSREEFNKIIFDKQYFEELCRSCLQGDHPTGLNCRWTAWRILLGLIPHEGEDRIREEVGKLRSYYESEYNKYMKIRPDVPLEADIDNPLSMNANNPWKSYYEDVEIKEKIILDTKRTYQEIPFFTLPSSQDLLLEILFIYSKQNPDLCYRQGMNELVAVITCVCYGENINGDHSQEDLFQFLNDEKYARADIYSVFNKIMQLNHKEMFIFGQNEKNNKKARKPNPTINRPNLPIVRRATDIQEKLLPRLNETLFNHLQSLEVDPHIYMIKWIRCMLSREFELDQVLRLWDSIFTHYHFYTPDSKKLEMLDYFCASMILSIADELLQKDDESVILGRLVKYHSIDNVTNIIKMSYHGVISKLRAQDARKAAGAEAEGSTGTQDNPVETEDPKEEAKKGMFLFNAGMSLLRSKPNKEQAASKYHQGLAQGLNHTQSATDIVDDPLALSLKTPIASAPQKEVSSIPEQKQENKDTNRFAHYFMNKLSFGKKEEENGTQESKQDKTSNIRNEEPGGINIIRKLSGDRDQEEENILKIETAIQLIQVENERLNSELITKALADLTSAFNALKKKHLT